MNEKGQLRFSDSLRQLEQRFSDGGQPGESDAQIAEDLINFILEAVRRSRGVLSGTAEGDAVDAEALSKMTEWDSDDPALLPAEKVLRRFATGRGADGVALLKRVITDRQSQVSLEQQRRASMPRRKSDSFGALIDCIVGENPTISENELVRRLRNEIGRDVILDMDDTEITLKEEGRLPVRISGLKDRLTRAKKKIAKAG